MRKFSFLLAATVIFLTGQISGAWCGYIATKADIEQRAIMAGVGEYRTTSKGQQIFVFVGDDYAKSESSI